MVYIETIQSDHGFQQYLTLLDANIGSKGWRLNEWVPTFHDLFVNPKEIVERSIANFEPNYVVESLDQSNKLNMCWWHKKHVDLLNFIRRVGSKEVVKKSPPNSWENIIYFGHEGLQLEKFSSKENDMDLHLSVSQCWINK